MAKRTHPPAGPSTDGFYVFFERKGFVTSPCGPLGDEEIAKFVAICLGISDDIHYTRIELHGPRGPKTIREYKQKEPRSHKSRKAPTGRSNSRRRS